MAEKQRGPPNITPDYSGSEKEKESLVGRHSNPKKNRPSHVSVSKEQKFKSGEEPKHFSFKISKAHQHGFSHHQPSVVRYPSPVGQTKESGPQKTIPHYPVVTKHLPSDYHVLQKHIESDIQSKIKITVPRSLKEQQDRLLETSDNQASLKRRSEEAYEFQSSPKQVEESEVQEKGRDVKKKQPSHAAAMSALGSVSHHHSSQQQQHQHLDSLPVSHAIVSKVKHKETPTVGEKYSFPQEKSPKRYHLIDRGDNIDPTPPSTEITPTHVSRSKLTEALLQDNVTTSHLITHSPHQSLQKKITVPTNDLKGGQMVSSLPTSVMGNSILASQLFNIAKELKETDVRNVSSPHSVKSNTGTSKPENKTVPGSIETRLMSPLKIETSLGTLPQFFSPGRMLEEMAARHASSPSQSSPQKGMNKVPFLGLGNSPLRLPSPSSDKTKSPSHSGLTPVSSVMHLMPPLSLSSPSLSPGGSLPDRHASPLIAGIPGFLPFPGLNLPLPQLQYSPSLSSPAISSPLSSELIGGHKDVGMQLYRGLSESFSPQISENKGPPPAHSDQLSNVKHITSSPIPPTAHLRISPAPVQQVVNTELPTDLSVKQQKVASIVTEIIKSARQTAENTGAQDTKQTLVPPFAADQNVKTNMKQKFTNVTHAPFSISPSHLKQSLGMNSGVPLNISLLQTKPSVISSSNAPPNVSILQTKPSGISTLAAPPNVSLLQSNKDVKHPIISLSRIPTDILKSQTDNFSTANVSTNLTKTESDNLLAGKLLTHALKAEDNSRSVKNTSTFIKTETDNLQTKIPASTIGAELYQTFAPKLSLPPNLFFASKPSAVQSTQLLQKQTAPTVNPFTFLPQSVQSVVSNIQSQASSKTGRQATSVADIKYSPHMQRSVEKSPANRLGSDGEDMPKLEPQVSIHCKEENMDALDMYDQITENQDELEEIQPFNMRLQNLSNFPSNSNNLYRSTYRSQSMAIHRLKVHSGCVTSAAKSLDLLRQNLQKSINKEISEIIQRYVDTYFKLGVANIQYNNGSSAAGEEHVHAVCRQILEEAKKMYIQERRSVTPIRDIPDHTSDSGSTEGRHTVVKRKRRFSDSGSVDSDIIIKRKKGRPIVSSGRSTPSKMKPELVKREGPKWDPERLTSDSLFVMGSRANKALGLGATRGRIYIKHPELFKYSGDQDDKQWLYEHHFMPATGGKTYLMILEDIKDLAETEEYRNSPGLLLKELFGFSVPDWMVEKMRSQMISQRTDVPKIKIRSRSTTPNDITIIKLDQYDSDPLEQPKELPFSSFRSPTPQDDAKDFSVSPSGTEEMFSSTVESDSHPCELSHFNMTGGFVQSTSPVHSDLDMMDDDPRLALT